MEFCDLFNNIISFIRTAAVAGAILGVMMYGLGKIVGGFFPEISNYTQDFVKKLAIGAIALGLGVSAVLWVFEAVGISVDFCSF